MFYQDNNDYMRDSYFYGNAGNGNGMMYGNMQNPYMQNNYQMPMGQNFVNQPMNLNNMYPQIYRIISPVANRVIANSNSQYMTEDNLNNMVDTVYNIVEGDVSSLMNTPSNQGDDTVQVNANVSSTNNRNPNSTTSNSSNNPSNDRRGNNNVMDNQTSNSRLLRDLIKIIIIKELLSRQNNNSNYNFMQNQSGLPMSYYNPMGYGMM